MSPCTAWLHYFYLNCITQEEEAQLHLASQEGTYSARRVLNNNGAPAGCQTHFLVRGPWSVALYIYLK